MSKQTDSMYATMVGIVLAIIVSSVIIIVVRFVFGGPEDTWICSKGEWIMHGQPIAPKPTASCTQ
jgi:hypothetical protein